mmetsp:Transcript_66005/g.204458  ORF Transcript_66005/g.204458 Transcript_66005/m.204458 type:complete len:178 (+) Transcript_66005:188-721(+)
MSCSLPAKGFPTPQRQAFALFDKYGHRHVRCTLYEDAEKLEAAMEVAKFSTDTDGVVIYRESSDGMPVGSVDVRGDRYAIARPARKILRSMLVSPIAEGVHVCEAFQNSQTQIRRGMRQLIRPRGRKECCEEGVECDIAFAHYCDDANRAGDAAKRKDLFVEYCGKYGSLYRRFWDA